MEKEICLGLLIPVLLFGSSTTTSSPTQNVVVLLADDAGFEMGAYLNKYCQTPNLDALAKWGLLFNNAFTSVSSCSPSRAQLLTGQASHSSGMYGLHQGVHNFNVLPAVNSLPNVLREQSNGHILSGIIGKKHVGAAANFQFDFEQTEEQHSINQIGRNITKIKEYTKEFLDRAKREGRPFFLLVAFHDPHRCGHITPQYGEFCERWGSGEEGMGSIPDWKPIYYDWRNLEVPPYLPDTDVVRQELAAQYMTTSRLDQGVGLVLNELQKSGFSDETLVIYTSDNGTPFPSGRTNLYEPGIREPLIISSPQPNTRRHDTTGAMASLLDIYPTILDVFRIRIQNDTRLTGKSLLPVLEKEPTPNDRDTVFGSQNYHEVTMAYPMRMVRNRCYKLIHNLNYWSYFPIDQDFYTSPTFQQILNATINKQPLPWYKTLLQYYKRPEWELYDIKADALERFNLVSKSQYSGTLKQLRQQLYKWQIDTEDPWRCAPHAVLQAQGVFKNDPVCLTLGHEALYKPPKVLGHYEHYVISQ
ncbi:N-sulphoglucosamine sulphohydrolase [Scaptodrosophila lebanonensis]|uniref:N-sulphoglucosamine sulphohydrolase n=1 Tax=Drosophila lebanonensis TaxID=7225 RepID=A0A6J2T4K5_DROLE|nr:N-sulphoglucosamine sulphohydrolase [Scaptodrosophila lebanonensis]